MKRIIAAVAFSALAVPALADNQPFEQTELDRAVANVAQRPVGEARYVAPTFEQYNPA